MGNQILNISNFSFDKNEIFFLFLFDLDEINIFKLIKNVKENFNCNCIFHPDNEIIKRRNSSNKSFLKGYFKRILSDCTEPYIYYSFNINGDFFKCYFNNLNDNEIILISNYGNAIIYDFNKIQNENLKVIKEIKLFE